jgi:hypothetical protein
MKRVLTLTLIFLLIIATASFFVPYYLVNINTEKKPFYVGVSFCGNTTAEAKLLIGKVKNYTNLFVLQSWPISRNETATKETCDYAVAQGLNIIINLGVHDENTFSWQLPLLDNAKQRWGDRFLGVYYDDEPGGVQLDYDWSGFSANYSRYFNRSSNSPLNRIYAKMVEANDTGVPPDDYDAEAEYFTGYVKRSINPERWKAEGIQTFTSDYALYWFDYLGGYDVMLAQFGWNNSFVQDIALNRGAARVQNKDWGAIITWKYTKAPYLDSGEEIYKQMRMAYEAGAKYVVIFNYPKIKDNPYGIMTDEHFEALERFWKDMMTVPNARPTPDSSKAEAALVLPKNYGWGMRNPEDRIWGFWGPDEKSPRIWQLSRILLSQYGIHLDIVYDDPAFPLAGNYTRIYYWNQTI